MYVGGRFHTDLGVVTLPEERFSALQKALAQFQPCRLVTAHRFRHLLGLIASMLDVIPWARFHMCPLQAYLGRHWQQGVDHQSHRIPISTVILEYLQSKLASGQAMSTIRVHASAISAFHSGISGLPIGRLPIISLFLAGAAKTRPPPVVLPTWSLQTILEFFTKLPLEPIHQLSLKQLTFC